MELIGRELGGIKLTRLIGTGGMGKVYRGRVVKIRRGPPEPFAAPREARPRAFPRGSAPETEAARPRVFPRGFEPGTEEARPRAFPRGSAPGTGAARPRPLPRGPAPGTEVAVKVLLPSCAGDPSVRSRFKREAGIGMTLRHPGVVRIYHVGSTRVGGERILFLVMELMRGVTLRTLLDESGSLSDDMLRRIGRQVAATLAVIHARGVVHRDIKPENVFLERGDAIKIGDFGLSQLAALSSTSKDRGFIGSVAYAAPERFGPGRARPLSDLYSLGVVLYEMAVGRNPFLKNDLAATIAAHMEFVPPSPEEAGALISPFLSRFIMALLEKDPRKRLGPSSRLAGILEKGETSRWWRSVRPSGAPGVISRRRARFDLARRTGFHGRAREIARLRRLLDAAGSGAGSRVAVIRGEAGVGKTRLVDRLFETMDREGREGELVMVSGLRSEVQVPYYSLIHAVLQALDLAETDRDLLRAALRRRIRALFGKGRAHAAEAFTRLLVSFLPGEAEEAMEPEAAGHLFVEFFTRLAGKRLLVLVVDDVQGTGPPTRKVILEIARHMKEKRIFMILTLRTGEAAGAGSEEHEGLMRFLSLLDEEGEGVTIDLGRLDRKEVEGLLADLGFPRKAASGRVGERIFEITEGNPYFVCEVARFLVAEGALNAEDPDWDRLLRYVPATIQDVFYRRLFKLSPEERRFLDFASVLGNRFRLDEVLAALELDLAAAARITSRLQNAFSLIRPASGGLYRFDHVLIREILYENLDDETRRSHHRRFATAVVRSAAGRPLTGREHLKAAVHFSRAGDHAAALEHFHPACGYLLYKGARENALLLAREAASHVEALRLEGRPFDHRLECRIYLGEADIAARLGKRAMEYRALRSAAVAAGKDRALAALVSLELGEHHAASSRFFSALSCIRAALEGMRRLGDAEGEARALKALAGVLHDMGDDAEALEALRSALSLLEKGGSDAARGEILVDTGLLLLEEGAFDEAGKAFREALLSLRPGPGNKEGIAAVLMGMGRLRRERGRLEQAEKAFSRAALLARRYGRLDLSARILADLGECLLERNRPAEALRALEEARHLARHGNNRKVLARATASLARLRSGRPEAAGGAGAVEDARQAVALAERDPPLPVRDRVDALSALAFVFLEEGKIRSAGAVVRKAERLLARCTGETLLHRKLASLRKRASL